MIYRNYLNISVLLVVAFFCIHFYEATVRKELDVHNYILKRILKDKEANIKNLQYNIIPNPQNSNADKIGLEELKSDFDSYNNALEHSGEVAKNKIQKLLLKYGIDELKDSNSNSHLIRQKLFYDKIEKQLSVLMEELTERVRFEEGKNINVIIKDRPENYEADKIYNLIFQPVFLHNEFLKEANCKYIISGKEYSFQNFPIEFSSLPDSITFLMNKTNRITGEQYNLKERHKLNL